MTKTLWFAFGSMGLAPLSLAQRANLLTEQTFERSLTEPGWRQESCCPYSVQRSDSLARGGRYSARFELRKTDPLVANGTRSELHVEAERTLAVERWYGFSLFLPANYVADPEPEILAQWHETPDFNRGETWRSPPVALFSENGRWRLHVIWATDTVNTNKTISGATYLELGACQPGQWTDWVFHIRFSWRNDGLLVVYKNGEPVATRTGPNAYNDKQGVFVKLGIYKWPWMPKNDRGRSTVSQRVVYADEVRIGNEKARYADVAPAAR